MKIMRIIRSSLFVVMLTGGILSIAHAAIDKTGERTTDHVLTGQVTNATDGNPIPGASVQVTGTSYNATFTTDAQGTYQCSITTGTYTVAFSAFRYVSQTVNEVTIVKDTTTILDAALTPVAVHTVSGVVCDALTSWPLYSRVTVSEYPDAGGWTDPVTGAYTIDQLEGTTCTLTFDAWVDGYLTATRVVPPLAAPQTLDVGLQIDIDHLAAPGYTHRTSYADENFEFDNGGFTRDETTSTTWEWGTPSTWPSSAASGRKCWGTNLDGDYANYEDTHLLSPVYHLSTHTAPLVVTWRQAYHIESCSWDHAYAEYHVDSGPWQIIWEHTEGTTQQTWQRKDFNIPDTAGSTVQFRFRLTSDSSQTYAGYYIDDFRFGSGTAAPDGGLIVGSVAGNAASPLVGAIVSNTSYTATTMATPDDPNVNDGFYTLYSPAGTQSVTVTAIHHTSETVSLTVPSGGTVRRNFLLPLVPCYTLSGIARDPLTGWPLYAQVECSADGLPTTSTWSDPFTGAYSLSLNASGNWSLTASAWLNGYDDAVHSIGFLSADTSLTLNLTPTIYAPGYADVVGGVAENFEGMWFPPTGWIAYDADGGDTAWDISTAYFHSGSQSAYHRYCRTAYQDGWLIAPQTTLNTSNSTVSFWEYSGYPEDYVKQSMWITTGTYSTPPAGWVEVAEFDNPVAAWRQQSVDLSTFTGQTVRFAFHYQGTDATSWYIDDVTQSYALSPPDGGLVGGFVTDTDTSQPLNGATVRIGDKQTQTVETPNDPAIGDGFYNLYSPAGSQISTASAASPCYYPGTATPTVPAGDIVRQDFALATVPGYPLSGSVRDAVTGWPLYARIECSADGYLTTSTWTDPFTGAYSVSLTSTGDWNITGAAWVNGYHNTSRHAGPLSAATNLTLNLVPTLSAPGYTTSTSVLAEGFEGNLFAPEDWTVNDMDGDSTRWSSSTATSHSGSWSATHLSNADTYQDDWLITPPMPLTALRTILSFWEYTGSPDNYVKHSLWIKTGASGWTELAELANPTDTWRQQVVDLSSYGGQTVWIAFRYEGQDATDWVIDDIEVSSFPNPTGGLVGGFVTDAMTSAYLTSATVAIHDQQTLAASTPDDANVPDGLYFLYAPPGDNPSTATCSGYAPKNVTVSTGAGQTTRQDYALDAGDLQVSPDSLQVYVTPGNSTTRTLTLTNIGTAALDFSTVEMTLGATSPPPAVAQPSRNHAASPIEAPVNTVYTTNAPPETGYDSAGNAPWLSLDPDSGTIATGESLNVTATMDSAGISPGQYRAALQFGSSTPYETTTVTITMVVSEQGSLQVNISPAEAITDGAQWRLEGENDLQWSDSGDIRADVPIGLQTVEFKDVTGWGTPANQTVTVTTVSMATANVTYERQTFLLRYLADTGGTVTEPTSQTVIYGQDGTAVTATADEGCYFTQWSDGSTDNPRQDTNVTQDITVTAQFARYTYQLTYIAGEHGTIDGETSRTFVVFHGNDGTTVTAVPGAGYWFCRWSDDSTMNPRIDTAVSSSVLVTALFSAWDTCLCTTQTCTIDSDNQFFLGLYNYAVGGNWTAWLDAQGSGTLSYCLPADQWLGFYLYDYTSGQWVRALYALKN